MVYNRKQEQERLSGLLALMLAALLLLSIVSVSQCANEKEKDGELSSPPGAVEELTQRHSRINRAVECAVSGGNVCARYVK